jgi:hypothetical protein
MSIAALAFLDLTVEVYIYSPEIHNRSQVNVHKEDT